MLKLNLVVSVFITLPDRLHPNVYLCKTAVEFKSAQTNADTG